MYFQKTSVILFAGRVKKRICPKQNWPNRTIINIENYRGNPKLEVLYPLVRELKILPEEIFFPENKVSSEIRDRVMLEISDCNKTELKALIHVIQSFKEAIRTMEEEAE